jgi:hypothetical protein
MGYSDNRSKELTQVLRDMQPAPTAEEKAKIQDAIDTYIRDRDDHLSSIRAIIGDTGENKRLGDVLDRLSRWEDSLKRFGDCLSSIRDVTTAALAFVTRTSFEEKQAIDGLRAARAGEGRDILVYMATNVETMIKALADKWSKLNGESGYFDAQEKQAVESIRKMVEETLYKTAPATDQLVKLSNDFYQFTLQFPKDVTQWVADQAKDLDKKDAARWTALVKTIDPGRYVKGLLTTALGIPSLSNGDPQGQLGELTKNASAHVSGLFTQRIEEYRSAIQRRTYGVLVLFNETRKDTDEFIKNNSFEAAKQKYQGISDALDRFASGLPTDGLKSDFGAFAKELRDMYGRHLMEMETMYNRFVSENQYRFFGPLGPDISEALTQTKAWEQVRVGLVNMGLEEKLRQFRSDVTEFIEVKMNDAVKRMGTELEGLDPEVRQSIQTAYEAFRDEVARQTRERVRQLDELFGKEQQLFRSDAVAAYLDRRILNDALSR